MWIDERLAILCNAVVARKPIQFCWSQEDKTGLIEENGLVRVQTSYCWAKRPDMVPLRDKETFLLLVPWGDKWLLYMNASGRTLIVRDPVFEDGREIEFWFTTVEDSRKHFLFV